MQLITNKVELQWVTPNPVKQMATAARICYQSEATRTDYELVKHCYSRKHLSVLEQASASILITTNRGVTHELVRHRMASYLQESTRYCNYSKDRFSSSITFCPSVLVKPEDQEEMESDLSTYEHIYMKWLSKGYQPQFARQFLPIATKSQIVMTCNFKEWEYVINLRTSLAAHPDMRDMMFKIKNIFKTHPETLELYTILWPE